MFVGKKDELLHDHNNDGIDRRGFFESCSARPTVTIRLQLGKLEGAAGRSATPRKGEDVPLPGWVA